MVDLLKEIYCSGDNDEHLFGEGERENIGQNRNFGRKSVRDLGVRKTLEVHRISEDME